MYSAQIVKDRIDMRRNEKNISNLEKMLKELDIGKSTIYAMTDKKGIGCFALAKIADRLDCSVDYLLGRTESPTSTYVIRNNNTTISGTQANIINNNETYDGIMQEFIKAFSELRFEDKVRVMQYVNDIKKSPSDGDDGE